MSSANAIREQSRNCVVAKADSRHSVKRVGERGQPCLTPFEEGKAVDSVVPSADVKISSVRRAEIMAVVCSPMPNADSVASRVSRCMLSKACCKSMNAMWPSEPVYIHLLMILFMYRIPTPEGGLVCHKGDRVPEGGLVCHKGDRVPEGGLVCNKGGRVALWDFVSSNISHIRVLIPSAAERHP